MNLTGDQKQTKLSINRTNSTILLYPPINIPSLERTPPHFVCSVRDEVCPFIPE